MRLKLKSFKEAQEDSVKVGWSYCPDRVCGLAEDAVPWGEYVTVIDNGETIDGSPLYDYISYCVPACCFAIAYTPYEDVPKSIRHKDALRYGTILTDDNLFDRCDDMASCVRIRTIAYENTIFYLKMVNGDMVEFKKIGENA